MYCSLCRSATRTQCPSIFEIVTRVLLHALSHTMTMTMIKNVIVSYGFNIFNTFINHYDQGFILNHRIPHSEKIL